MESPASSSNAINEKTRNENPSSESDTSIAKVLPPEAVAANGNADTAATPQKNAPAEEFHPGASFYLAFSSLAILTAVVALDGTTPAVALPVSPETASQCPICLSWELLRLSVDHCK